MWLIQANKKYKNIFLTWSLGMGFYRNKDFSVSSDQVRIEFMAKLELADNVLTWSGRIKENDGIWKADYCDWAPEDFENSDLLQ